MENQKCCHGECRQGRDCPNRQDCNGIIEWLKAHAPLTLQKYLRSKDVKN